MTIETNSSKSPTNQEILPKGLLQDLRHMIDQTSQSIASTEILQDKRTKYRQKIIATVSRQLVKDYGNSFVGKNLLRMIKFAHVFTDKEIVVSEIRLLNWPYFVTFSPIKDALSNESLQNSYNGSHYDCKRR